MKFDLSACPTNEHPLKQPQCGYGGCIDLRPWAKANCYRYRLEESYQAESNAYVRGDARWFVEILCRNGLIYPYGGTILLAYAKAGIVSAIAELPGADLYQTDGKARVFKFRVEQLDTVAAILKPRIKRAVGASPEKLAAMRERRKTLVQVRQINQERTIPAD